MGSYYDILAFVAVIAIAFVSIYAVLRFNAVPPAQTVVQSGSGISASTPVALDRHDDRDLDYHGCGLWQRHTVVTYTTTKGLPLHPHQDCYLNRHECCLYGHRHTDHDLHNDLSRATVTHTNTVTSSGPTNTVVSTSIVNQTRTTTATDVLTTTNTTTAITTDDGSTTSTANHDHVVSSTLRQCNDRDHGLDLDNPTPCRFD